MRKLSELLLEEQLTIEKGTLPSLPSPTLILFNDVLDPEKVLLSPEIALLVKYCFGEASLSFAQAENPEQLHDLFREEQYKSITNGRTKIYPFKARFEDLAWDSYNDQFFGPLHAHVFPLENTDNNVITITCGWGDGVFRNDYFVIGAIINSRFLEELF